MLNTHQENALLATMSRRVTVLPQSDWRNTACEFGNRLNSASEEAGKYATPAIVGGAAVTGVGFATLQPVLVGAGTALMGAGSGLSLISGGLQLIGGLFQGIQTHDFSNAQLAGIGLATGFGLGKMMSGNTAFLQSASRIAGGVNDAYTSLVPNVGPRQSSCTNH